MKDVAAFLAALVSYYKTGPKYVNSPINLLLFLSQIRRKLNAVFEWKLELYQKSYVYHLPCYSRDISFTSSGPFKSGFISHLKRINETNEFRPSLGS